MKRLLLPFGFAIAIALAMGGPATAQETDAGPYAALSTGNQKIVNSIYDSQIGSDNELAGGALLTTDQIAAMKADTGWGNVYKTLLANDPSLVTYKNLGQAVSSYQRQTNPSSTVVTTGTGAQIVTGEQTGQGPGSSSLKGGNASSQGSGNKFGHFKNSGITTGAGGTVGGGANGFSTAGGSSFGGAGGSKGRGRGSRGRR